MICRCFSIALILWLYPIVAHSNISPAGAPALSMAGVSVVSGNLWSCFNNPAGLVSIGSFAAGTFYESRFLLADLAFKGIAVTVPLSSNTYTGVAISEFGNPNFSDRIVSATLSRGFGPSVKAGLRAEWQSVSFAGDYSSGSGITVCAGMMVRISKQAEIGVTLMNPSRSTYSGSNERMPSCFRTGIKWEVSSAARCFLEFEKMEQLPYTIRTAVEYAPTQIFVLRAGVSNSYVPFSIGCGFKVRKLTIEIASGYHRLLGITPAISLIWSGKK